LSAENANSSIRDNTSDTNISFITGNKKNGSANITMDGYFLNNGTFCEVSASGEVEFYDLKRLGKLQLGHLKGTAIIGEYERNINVNYEKSSDNLYYSITINELENEEGFAVISFGESIVDKDALEEMGLFKDIEKNEEKVSLKSFDPVDSDWVELRTYGGAICKGRLFLEDDIIDDGDDGKMLVTVQVDKDEAEDVIEDAGYTVLLIKVDEFEVDFDSVDEESSFGNHHPDESDSKNTVFNFIVSAFNALPSIPSSVISAVDT